MKKMIMDGNKACAHIAYMFSDAVSVYPITHLELKQLKSGVLKTKRTYSVKKLK